VNTGELALLKEHIAPINRSDAAVVVIFPELGDALVPVAELVPSSDIDVGPPENSYITKFDTVGGPLKVMVTVGVDPPVILAAAHISVAPTPFGIANALENVAAPALKVILLTVTAEPGIMMAISVFPVVVVAIEFDAQVLPVTVGAD
jgi:hypothetical protein